ncbi:MAG TPA: TonB-dependent receptor [Woeseiaceae bacterium]|nr:TonB-dependent receptor [Woeseiaceae bacterium]
MAQQQKSGSILEEVVVTAQKREQSLQDVGISVTAFTGDQIQQLGFTNSTDVVSMTPGLTYTVPNAASSQINFFLRGVGLNDFADANENPVAVYVDDVYHPAMGGLNFQLFDVERVEVLRGPQGTLFGRNTTGGLVHFISKRPTRELDGYFMLTAGDYSQIKAEGAIGGPLSDTISGRIAVATNENDGWTENRAPAPDYNSTDAQAVRGQLLFTPSDTVDVLVQAHYSKNDASVGAWQHQATQIDANGESVPLGPNEQTTSVDCNADGMLDAGDARPAPGTDCFGYRDTDGDPYAGEFDRDGRVKVENTGVSLNLNWDIGDMTLTSITAFQNVDRLQSEDTDAGPFPLIQPTFQAETDTFSQEFRLAGGSDNFRWVGGLYYFDNDVDGHYTLDLTNIGFVYFDANFTQKTESIALFGQVEFDLSDKWTLILGARGAQEEKTLDYLNVDTSGFFTDVVGLPTNVAFEFDQNTVGDLAVHDESSFSGKAQLDWRPMDNLLVYGSLSQGTKSAGFNVGFLDETFLFASNTVDTIPYGSETLRSFEVGFKSTLGNGTTRLNGAAFVYDYQDFQTFRFELLNQVIFNTDADVSGGELELQSSPIDGLDLALGLAVLDANAKDIPSPDGVLRTRHMVAAPDFSANALVRYAWPVGNSGRIALQAWANYQDASYFDIQNVPVSRQDGYTVSNLRASYSGGDGQWELAAFVHNLTDEAYLNYTFDFTGTFGFNQQAYGQPRWFGVSFQYNLD